MLTNEDLVVKIKNGNAEYIDILWHNIEKNARITVNTFFRKHIRECQVVGLEKEDLYQIAFLALSPAIKTFDTSLGYKFLTVFYASLKWRLLESVKSANYTPQNIISLDEPLNDDNDSTYADIIQDPTAENDVEFIIEKEYQTILKQDLYSAISKLPENQAFIVKEYYLKSRPVKDIAARLKLSTVECYRLKKLALKTLRNDERVKKYAFQYKKKQLEDRYSRGFGYRQFRETGMSSQEMYMIKLEELEKAFGLS